MAHLMRGVYPTDASENEPEYDGSFSATIPDTWLGGVQIVGVDWSKRGLVEVTFLLPGDGYRPTEEETE